MSSREYLYDVAREALRADHADAAEAVVDAVMPLVTEPRQMLGVPEGSILLVEVQAGVRALRWEDGLLHGNLRADGMPMTAEWTIGRYGPLTVVWMP